MKTTWLVAHDFSPAADAAMMAAASDLSRMGGRLVLLHVYQLPPAVGGLESFGDAGGGLATWNRLSNQARSRAAEKIELVADKLRKRFPQLDIDSAVTEGESASGVLKVAEEEHAARIVIGFSPRPGLLKRIAGSIGHQIVRQAPIPVLVVKA